MINGDYHLYDRFNSVDLKIHKYIIYNILQLRINLKIKCVVKHLKCKKKIVNVHLFK